MSFLLPGLYIIATPIGNLKDITYRAVQTLEKVDYILCEDTRITSKLLQHYAINKPLMVYNDHSTPKMRAKILKLLQAEKAVALVSDAGTPIISDPGYKLVRECKEEGYHVEALPGAAAPINALVLSALPPLPFTFLGFSPKGQKAKENFFTQYLTSRHSLIFFETAGRLLESLQVLQAVFGEVEVCVAREMTKLHQEIKRASPLELYRFFQDKPGSIKGEIVVVVHNKGQEAHAPLEEQIQQLFSEGLSAKDIVTRITAQGLKDKSLSKKAIYDMANKVKQEGEGNS